MKSDDFLTHLELKIPPLLLAIIFIALSWITDESTYSDVLRVILVPFFGITGIFVIVAGVISFRGAKTTVNPNHPEKATQLVKGGIFRFTRNPMYLGFFMILIAWSIHLNSILSMAINLAFPIYMNKFQIKPEEKALENMFGSVYKEYRKQTPRWI